MPELHEEPIVNELKWHARTHTIFPCLRVKKAVFKYRSMDISYAHVKYGLYEKYISRLLSEALNLSRSQAFLSPNTQRGCSVSAGGEQALVSVRYSIIAASPK